MADQVIAFTTSDLMAALVVLLGTLAALCVWVFLTTVASLKEEIKQNREQFIKQLEAQNLQIENAIEAINEAFDKAGELQRDMDRQVHVLRERTAMLFKLSSKP